MSLVSRSTDCVIDLYITMSVDGEQHDYALLWNQSHRWLHNYCSSSSSVACQNNRNVRCVG